MGQHVNVLFGLFQIYPSMRPVAVRTSLAPLDHIALIHCVVLRGVLPTRV